VPCGVMVALSSYQHVVGSIPSGW